jgi:hypothetical protein
MRGARRAGGAARVRVDRKRRACQGFSEDMAKGKELCAGAGLFAP